jgi:hypothetical protein
MEMATVIEILKAHLVANGFDGLVNGDAGCGCEISELAPCDECFSQCQPGYKHLAPAECPSGLDWAIWLQKEPPTPEQWAQMDY